MSLKPKVGLIEKFAEGIGLIPKLNFDDQKIDPINDPGDLSNYPPPEKWDDWVEFEPTKWSQKKERHYTIVPTSCFNCEAGCGLLSYVDKETGEVRKFEGNPYHPASRGRNCAKGPATINQIKDPDRILHPMRRIGKRGAGKWERVSWDVVLDEIAAKIKKAIRGYLCKTSFYKKNNDLYTFNEFSKLMKRKKFRLIDKFSSLISII